MKTISLNPQIIEKYDATVGECLLLLALDAEINVEDYKETLIKKGYITAFFDNKIHPVDYRITNKGYSFLNSIILDSDKHQEPQERLEGLASQLKEIFPKGKKDGTNYYWTEGVPLIIKRLKLFFRKYGTEYTDEQILQAAKKYVESFNGNYIYMKLLKYFILKEKSGAAGDIESESELINYIENAGQEELIKNDWQNTLI